MTPPWFGQLAMMPSGVPETETWDSATKVLSSIQQELFTVTVAYSVVEPEPWSTAFRERSASAGALKDRKSVV